MDTIGRRCDFCGVKLAVGLVESDKLHCYCPQCGTCVTFISKDKLATEEAKEFEKPSKYYN